MGNKSMSSFPGLSTEVGTKSTSLNDYFSFWCYVTYPKMPSRHSTNLFSFINFPLLRTVNLQCGLLATIFHVQKKRKH